MNRIDPGFDPGPPGLPDPPDLQVRRDLHWATLGAGEPRNRRNRSLWSKKDGQDSDPVGVGRIKGNSRSVGLSRSVYCFGELIGVCVCVSFLFGRMWQGGS